MREAEGCHSCAGRSSRTVAYPTSLRLYTVSTGPVLQAGSLEWPHTMAIPSQWAPLCTCCCAKKAVFAESDKQLTVHPSSPAAGPSRRLLQSLMRRWSRPRLAGAPVPVQRRPSRYAGIDGWVALSLHCCGDLQVCTLTVLLACHPPALLFGPQPLGVLAALCQRGAAVWLMGQDLLLNAAHASGEAANFCHHCLRRDV